MQPVLFSLGFFLICLSHFAFKNQNEWMNMCLLWILAFWAFHVLCVVYFWIMRKSIRKEQIKKKAMVCLCLVLNWAHIFHTLEIDKFVNTFTCPNISLVTQRTQEDTLFGWLEVGWHNLLLYYPLIRNENDCACVWHCIFDCLLFDGDVITENILNCLLNETINQCPIFVCGENKKKTEIDYIGSFIFFFFSVYDLRLSTLVVYSSFAFIYMRPISHTLGLVNR